MERRQRGRERERRVAGRSAGLTFDFGKMPEREKTAARPCPECMTNFLVWRDARGREREGVRAASP